MTSGFEEIVDSDSDFSSRSIPELISFLKSSFRDTEFDAVESVLVSRESTLKAVIEKKDEDNKRCQEIDAFLLVREEKLKTQNQTIMKEQESIKEEYEVERLKNINLENELQKCQVEVLELGVRNSLISEEIKQCRDREDILKREKCVLESEKRRAETEVEMWKRRFRDLEMGIANLEKDASVLMKLENMEPVISDEMKEEKEETDENMQVLIEENGVDFKIEANSINYNDDVKSNGAAMVNSGSSRPPSHAFVEIIDSDDDCDARGYLVSKDRALDSPNSGQTGKENETRMLKRKQPSSPVLSEDEGRRNGDHKDVDDSKEVDSIPIGQHEMEKATELIHGPFNSLVNNCSAINGASGSHNSEKFSSGKTRRQCGEETRANAFQNFMSSLSSLSLPQDFLDSIECSSSSSSSCSSDSEDD